MNVRSRHFSLRVCSCRTRTSVGNRFWDRINMLGQQSVSLSLHMHLARQLTQVGQKLQHTFAPRSASNASAAASSKFPTAFAPRLFSGECTCSNTDETKFIKSQSWLCATKRLVQPQALHVTGNITTNSYPTSLTHMYHHE